MMNRMDDQNFQEEKITKLALYKKLQREIKEFLDHQLHDKEFEKAKQKEFNEDYHKKQQEILLKQDELDRINNQVLKVKIYNLKQNIEEMNKSNN